MKCVAIILLTASTAFAQRRGNEATDIVVDTLGNVYATGRYITLDSGACLTAKINPNGKVLWARRSNCGSGKSAVVIGEKGNIYVTGTFKTIKYNSEGAEQWTITNNGLASSLAIGKSENIHITGTSADCNFPPYDCDYITTKYNSDGVQQWVAKYSGPGGGNYFYDGAIDIVIDTEENVYVTGQSYGPNGYDYATIKYSFDGLEQWVVRYDGSAKTDDMPSDIAVDQEGNIYVTGQGYEPNLGRWDYATVKYNSVGAVLWVAKYDGPGYSDDIADALAVDRAGKVYVTGRSIQLPDDYLYVHKIITIKYDLCGIAQWVAIYDAKENRRDKKVIAVDDSGNVYVAGTGTDAHIVVTIKYNFDGIEEWVATFPEFGVPRAIVTDKRGNVFVAGLGAGSACVDDFIVIKYNSDGMQEWVVRYECSPFVSVEENSRSLPAAFYLCPPFPNPFNSTTIIRFYIPQSAFVNLTVYDISGRNIETILNQQIDAPIHGLLWNASSQPSGVYLLSMISGEFKQTRKLVLLK